MKKTISLLASLHREPWLIKSELHEPFASVCARVLGSGIAEPQGEPSAGAIVSDSVLVVPISGVMIDGIGPMGALIGAVDTGEIADLLRKAQNDPTITGVVLSVDSPGGQITGTPELADTIAELDATKPVIAHTSGMMASAAYWISAGCRAIYATGSSTVGSIGVYVPVIDSSRAYENAGLKVDVVKSSATPMKAAGFPGTSLSEEQRADLQGQVDFLYGQFSGFVAQNRGVPAEAMKGQTFFGSQAVELGLIDAVAALDQAVADVAKLAALRNR